MRVKNSDVKKVALGLVVIMIAGALLSGIAGIAGAGKDQPGESEFVVP